MCVQDFVLHLLCPSVFYGRRATQCVKIENEVLLNMPLTEDALTVARDRLAR